MLTSFFDAQLEWFFLSYIWCFVHVHRNGVGLCELAMPAGLGGNPWTGGGGGGGEGGLNVLTEMLKKKEEKKAY